MVEAGDLERVMPLLCNHHLLLAFDKLLALEDEVLLGHLPLAEVHDGPNLLKIVYKFGLGPGNTFRVIKLLNFGQLLVELCKIHGRLGHLQLLVHQDWLLMLIYTLELLLRRHEVGIARVEKVTLTLMAQVRLQSLSWIDVR